MECVGRGLAFWSYQSTQEMYDLGCLIYDHLLIRVSVYQEYLAKTLTDKYGNLNQQVDKIVNDANCQINSLNQKLGG